MSNEVGSRSRLERIIWRGLGSKTAREIAEEAGVAPEEILAIKRDMLNSVDSLTVQEKQTKLLADLSEVAEIALEHARHVGGDAESRRNLGPILTSAIQAMKTVLSEVRALEKMTSNKVETLNQRRIDGLALIMQMTINTTVPEFDDGQPHTADEMFARFNENAIAAAEELMRREQESG